MKICIVLYVIINKRSFESFVFGSYFRTLWFLALKRWQYYFEVAKAVCVMC